MTDYKKRKYNFEVLVSQWSNSLPPAAMLVKMYACVCVRVDAREERPENKIRFLDDFSVPRMIYASRCYSASGRSRQNQTHRYGEGPGPDRVHVRQLHTSDMPKG